ncbi:MAG TPA: acyltransferase [Methylotenera sp.]|nr:acyltransferase [Methylotenera sp.]HPH06120.1 acyltransferase [Methylotenera sp.]HPN00323.1 acyltransferase [Methylotenera sp.]
MSTLILFAKGLGIFLVFSHHYARSVWLTRNLHEPLLQQWQFAVVEHKFMPLLVALSNGELFDSLMLFFAYFGYVGVHLFIVASGIGLALGYREDENWLKFMLRRITKIIPPFWIALLFFSCIWWFIGSGHSIDVIIRKMLLISTLYEDEFLAIDSPLWFVGLIFQLYVIFPALYKIAKKYGVVLLPILIFLSYAGRYLLSIPEVVAWNSYIAHGNFINWLAVFYAAILLGKSLRNNQQISFKKVNLVLLGFVSLAISMVALNSAIFYPFADSALAMFIVLLSLFLFNLSSRLSRYMMLIGNVSFCIYLYHRPVVDKLLILLYKKNLSNDINLFLVYAVLFSSMIMFFNFLTSLNHPILKYAFPRG